MDIRGFASVIVLHEGRILLVEEGRADNFGLLNLPGGHLEHGERLTDCAVREAREEAQVHVELSGLLGVYTGLLDSGVHALRFVFLARMHSAEAKPGDDIHAVHWSTLEDALALAPERLVSAEMFARILRDVQSGVRWPLDVLSE